MYRSEGCVGVLTLPVSSRSCFTVTIGVATEEDEEDVLTVVWTATVEVLLCRAALIVRI